jgi:hypothetical protein
LPVAGTGGSAIRGAIPLGPPRCHPLTPFVVGEKGGGDEEDGEDAEEKLHGRSRESNINSLWCFICAVPSLRWNKCRDGTGEFLP